MMIPAYATKTIQVTKELDIRKDLLAKTLEDPKSYREIFPALVKDVKTSPDDKGRVKFVIDAMGTRETDVKLSRQSGAFVVEILSGDLKGSKITTTLKERSGFNGEPNGGTTVKCVMILEYGLMVSIAMMTIDKSQIGTEVGNGFYKLSEYAKKKHSQENLINVDYSKSVVPKLEAAKKLDPQKEAKKVKTSQKDKVETISMKREAAKKLISERHIPR